MLTLSVFDSATGLQKTGDGSNCTFYVDIDDAGPGTITSNSGVPTEIDNVKSKGDYKIALSQAETNGNKLHFTGKSVTSGIVVVSKTIYTVPANFTLLSIDGSGKVITPDTQKVDVNTIKTQAVTCAAGVTVNVNVGTTQPINFTGTAGSALAKVDVIDLGGSAQSATDLKDFADTGYDPATHRVEEVGVVDSLDTVAQANVADAVWDEATSAHTVVGSFGKLTTTNLDQTIGSRMATYSQPTGFLAATFPGTVASTTNITAASGVALTSAYDAAKTASSQTSVTDIQSRIPAALGANGNMKSDVRDFGGTSGVFSSGRPEVNTVLIEGVAPVTYINNNFDGIISVKDVVGTLTSTERNKIADHVRRRTQANVEASTDGDALNLQSLYGTIQQMQEANTTTHAGKLTVFKRDGTTELGQITITTDPAAEPITGAS